MQPAHIVLAEALALPEADRADLALRLMESLEGTSDLEVEDAWAREVVRRARDVDAGSAKTRPLDEAVREAREWLRRGRD